MIILGWCGIWVSFWFLVFFVLIVWYGCGGFVLFGLKLVLVVFDCCLVEFGYSFLVV